MTGPIYKAVRHSQGQPDHSQLSPTAMISDQKQSRADVKAATRGRKIFCLITSFLFFVSLVFLILINIGNVSNHHVLGDIYFFKIDVSHIIPKDVPNATLINSLARSIGLHDFYQVGLWDFCEGYNGQGITSCSKPKLMYWFNPVQILLDELLEGASISLPSTIITYLRIIRIASHAMFICFFASIFTSFLCIFLAPLSVYSRLAAIPIGLFALISALLTTVGTVISTVMWTIFSREINKVANDINIIPSIGREMFVFTWIAAGCALLAAFGQLGLMCCGTSRRDVQTGRKGLDSRRIRDVNERRVGRKERFEGGNGRLEEENPAARRKWWGSVSQ